jgi:glycosyltransferase involved in cell wall biosynthesis
VNEPRVLRAITRLNIGGPARQAALMHRELPRHGFASHLLVGGEDPREGHIDAGPTGVTEVADLHRRIDPLADVRAYGAIDRFIRAWRPDVLHTHMAKAGALARTSASRRGVGAIVHTFHGHVLEGYFPKPVARTFVLAERRLARRTDALVAVAPEIRDELLFLGVGRRSQWHVIPVGVELDSLLDSRVDRSDARRTLGLSAEGRAVGIVGRLVPIKDHRVFLDAAARLALTHPDVSFVVAGDGELRETLEAQARPLGDRVRFLGWALDLPTLYAAFDVVVLTSKNEGTPFSLIEAGASGRPSVATDVGGVREVVLDGETGVLVPPGDAEAVAAATAGLLDDADRATAYGEAARAHVRQRYAATSLVGNLTSLYSDLLSVPKGRT